MEGLLAFQNHQILKAFESSIQNLKKKKSVILVTDDHTTRILSACLKVHQLNDIGIRAIVNIKNEREKGNWNVVYFLSPCIKSFKQLVDDYKNEKRLQYSKNVTVLVTSTVTPECMELVRNSKLPKYLRKFEDIYSDFFVLESRVWHFNRPESLHKVFWSDWEEEVRLLSTRLLSVIATMQEKPYIRYAKNSLRASSMAEVFTQAYYKNLSKTEYDNPKQKQATVLILDRADDVAGPLLHDLSYQSLVTDLLDNNGRTVMVSDTEFEFNTDDLWKQFRHHSMGNVINDLQTQFNEFKDSSAIAKSQKGDQENLKTVLRDLPEYTKKSKSFNSHFSLTRTLVQMFNEFSLNDVAEMEQTIVTQISSSGKLVKPAKVYSDLTRLFKEKMLSDEIKVRLLLIYIICQEGITDKEQKKLVDAADLSAEQLSSVYGLLSLGVKIRDQGKAKQRVSVYHTEELKARAIELSKSEIICSRFEPLLSNHLRKFAQGNLSESKFPYFGKNPKDMKSEWNFFSESGGKSLRSPKMKKKDKKRLIVFVIGGISYPEIRQCYILSEELDLDCYIGSSHVMTPNEYVKLLEGPEKDSEESEHK